MDSDYILIGGILLVLLAIPSLLTAFSSMDPPRLGAILIVLGMGMIWYAAQFGTQDYTWQDVPNVFFRVLGEIF